MNLANQTKIKIGSDICSVVRIKRAYEKYGSRFIDKVLTENEKNYVLGKSNLKSPRAAHKLAEALAARFAAKEAVVKALGTGWRGIHWREIEVINAESGAPQVILHGRAKDLLLKLTLSQIEISLSHEQEFAIAFALIY